VRERDRGKKGGRELKRMEGKGKNRMVGRERKLEEGIK